jgi:16S rRNA (uracil1498-N3)-methyltransferase
VESGGKAANWHKPRCCVAPGGESIAREDEVARYDFRSPRLHVEAALAAGASVALDAAQANYLVNVLRLKPGAAVLVFNGRDGEWRAALTPAGRRAVALTVAEQTRGQTARGDLHLLFAPLKHARLDYMVQKAVEMGVSRLVPVLTQHGQVARVNLERMRANAVEAAEQCGILALPEIAEPVPLQAALAAFDPQRLMVFCDEEAEVGDPVAALAAAGSRAAMPLALCIGPEGGFAEPERAALLRLPHVVRLALGPRILRADTAAVAALAVVQAVVGDWTRPDSGQ